MVGRISMGPICDLWVRLVIYGCGFVLWCAMGLFCGAILVVVVSHFLFIYLFCLIWVEEKVWFFFFFFPAMDWWW